MRRSISAPAVRRAFTLVELLVVIGIIAVLVSILLPALNKARQAADSVKCGANMRQIGQGIYIFAQSHNGRAPGAAGSTGTPGAPKYIPWQTVLSKEVFDAKNPNFIPWVAINGTFPNQLGIGKLYCPNCLLFTQTGTQFYRTYAINLFVNGGYFGNKGYSTLITATSWGAQYPPQGQYGGSFIVAPYSQSIDAAFTVYYYTGSRLAMFKNPASKYMITEEDRNDTLDTNTAGVNVMNDDVTYPPYDTANGKVSYRHNFKTNILFVDGHVELRAFDPRVRNSINMLPY